MLTSINIKSFRSCRDVSLDDLHSMLVLIGRNGAGKTNVMKAVAWACQFGAGPSETPTPSQRLLMSSDGDVRISFRLGAEDYRYEVKKKSRVDEMDKEPTLIREVEESIYLVNETSATRLLVRSGEFVSLNVEGSIKTIRIASATPCLPALHALLPDEDKFKIVAEKILTFLSSVKYYPLHNFEEADELSFITGDVYRKWKANKLANSNSLVSLQCTLIEISEEHPDILVELNALLGRNGLRVVDDVKVEAHSFRSPSDDGKVTSFYWVAFKMPYSDERQNFSISDLSFGTVRILFLIVSMLYDKASVALLEQPEDGVHMALVKKLLPMLRAYSDTSQFIISSHSSAVMNLTHPSEIRFITNDTGFTEARALSADELNAAHFFLEEDGALSEFLQTIGD